MERWVAKVIAIIISFTLPFFFTMLPYSVHGYISKKGKTGERVICYLMCFGGGIFFGTFLLHMGPEVRLILGIYVLEPNNIIYPLADLIIGAGFFFVLFLEKCIMRINKRKNERHRRRLQEQQQATGTVSPVSNVDKVDGVDVDKVEGVTCVDYKTTGQICNDCVEKQPCQGGENEDKGLSSLVVELFHVTEFRDVSTDDVVMKAGQDRKEESDVVQNLNKDGGTTTDESCHNDKELGHVHKTQEEEDEDSHHNVRSLVLVIALSLHHIFEGLTVGLQHTVHSLFTLVIAIMCHECIISFSVGLQFVKCHYTLRRHLLIAFLVCIIMPIGEAIGTAMSEAGAESNELEIASGVLQAFSAGTFIFVTFFEILQEEISPHDTSIGKILSAFTGFITMALLMLIPEE